MSLLVDLESVEPIDSCFTEQTTLLHSADDDRVVDQVRVPVVGTVALVFALVIRVRPVVVVVV
jgi:hypothetical protein